MQNKVITKSSANLPFGGTVVFGPLDIYSFFHLMAWCTPSASVPKRKIIRWATETPTPNLWGPASHQAHHIIAKRFAEYKTHC